MSLGLGVMIQAIGGNAESVAAMQAATGKTIAALAVDNELRLDLADGSTLWISDQGQSCCESRYMSTDDDLSPFVGATLVSAEVRHGPDSDEDEYGNVHETAFLVVTTSFGAFTCVTHNEHNGYYGGFWIVARTS